MADSREAELEAEIRRLKAQNRRLVDAVNDAEEMTRVYRRLAYRFVVRCGECPLCEPRLSDSN